MAAKTINIRVTKAEKERLQKVAADAGVTLSAFLRSAARLEAHRVLGAPKVVEQNPNTVIEEIA